MAAVELVGAVAEQEHHALLAEAARQEGAERAGRAVGPVHVLEDQHEGLPLAEQVEQLHHRFEQLQLRRDVLPVRRRRVVEAGQQRGQLGSAAGAQRAQRRVAFAHQRSQRAEQRRVRQLAVGLFHALPPQGEYPVGDPALELEHEPRLADTRFTTQ
jgi:hypothetical protein